MYMFLTTIHNFHSHCGSRIPPIDATEKKVKEIGNVYVCVFQARRSKKISIIIYLYYKEKK